MTVNEVVVGGARPLRGRLRVPGDKSISHRAVLLGAVGEGETMVRGFGRSRDTEATLAVVRALGVEAVEEDVDLVRIEGRGLGGLEAPAEPIDCANSGTLLRLLAGILAGQEGRFELTGDESLRSRPVRVDEPLAQMGARVETEAPNADVGRPLSGATRGASEECVMNRP